MFSAEILLITEGDQQFEYRNTEEGDCLAKENLNSTESCLFTARRPDTCAETLVPQAVNLA